MPCTECYRTGMEEFQGEISQTVSQLCEAWGCITLCPFTCRNTMQLFFSGTQVDDGVRICPFPFISRYRHWLLWWLLVPTLLIYYAIAFLALVAVSPHALILLVGPVDASAGYCSEGRYMGRAVVDHH